MTTVDIHTAKMQLSHLVETAAKGEETIISRAGVPLARLTPLKSVRGRRRLGSLAGRLTVPEDFDAPLSDGEVHRFEGA